MSASFGKKAFTLIEMLVVIIVIAVLAGMVLKLMALARAHQQRAACVTVLERVAMAINEYRAEYGVFPPVATNACPRYLAGQYGVRCHRTDCRTCYVSVPSDDMLLDLPRTYNHFKAEPNASSGAMKFGLVSYLVPRDVGGYGSKGVFSQNSLLTSTRDSNRDENAKRRWAGYLEGLIKGRDDVGASAGLLVSNSTTTCFGEMYPVPVYTIVDPWGNVLRYRSEPPYTSYELWSPGPDGMDGDGSAGSGDDARRAVDNLGKTGRWD